MQTASGSAARTKRPLPAATLILVDRSKGAPRILMGRRRPDAVFLPEPFATPIRGRGAIRDYWRDVPREQAEIAFRFGEIFVAGPWFATEYKCTFRRRRTGEAVVVRGALFCETIDGRVSEMRMYWDRAARRG